MLFVTIFKSGVLFLSSSMPTTIVMIQMTVTDSEGLEDSDDITMVVGEPFSLVMTPESEEWVVGDTVKASTITYTVGYCWWLLPVPVFVRESYAVMQDTTRTCLLSFGGVVSRQQDRVPRSVPFLGSLDKIVE